MLLLRCMHEKRRRVRSAGARASPVFTHLSKCSETTGILSRYESPSPLSRTLSVLISLPWAAVSSLGARRRLRLLERHKGAGVSAVDKVKGIFPDSVSPPPPGDGIPKLGDSAGPLRQPHSQLIGVRAMHAVLRPFAASVDPGTCSWLIGWAVLLLCDPRFA